MELDGLKVNHAGLDQAADDLIGIVNRIDARMHDLERELNPLRANWIGDAQQAYTAAKARWDTAITEMRDLLRSTSQQVVQSNAEYRAADTRRARAFEM
jgi:6 kDa early secretory antigenic target